MSMRGYKQQRACAENLYKVIESVAKKQIKVNRSMLIVEAMKTYEVSLLFVERYIDNLLNHFDLLEDAEGWIDCPSDDPPRTPPRVARD